MIITNCPRCGSMNATTTCTKCGWSQFTTSTVSTRITGEIEIMLSGKALLDDYKRLLLENRNLKERVAELEAEQARWIPVSERLPQIGVRVLFYNNFTKNIHKGWYFGDEWTSGIGVFYNGDKLKRITHWMPLPESPNDTQTETFVYGKDSKPLPCPFCGEIVKECNDVATPIDVALRKRIAELEGKIDQLTAHSDIERQDDKWIPEVQE